MKDITFFIRDIGNETGVTVSVRHLCKILDSTDITYEVIWYKDDNELLSEALRCDSKCINLQVPSFSDDTLDEILRHKDNVVISIHSTMCNLQVEEGSLGRLIRYGCSDYDNLKFTCPSQRECDGFNSVVRCKYLYLPNTFSYECDDSYVDSLIENKKNLDRTIKISLVSAYRPFKNMITQTAAVIMLSKEYDAELHLFDSSFRSPVYNEILNMAKFNDLKVVMHPQASNYDCFKTAAEFDIGLQVSLSETFSYVAFEHMIQGVPTVGSQSVRFSSEIADYSDVNDIYKRMKNIIESSDTFEEYCRLARQKAVEVLKQNSIDAVAAVREMIQKI